MKSFLLAALTVFLFFNFSNVASAQSNDWTQDWKTTSLDGRANDDFGVSVAVSGNTAVVGAFAHDTNNVENQGAAYVYVRDAGNGAWNLQAKLTAADGTARDLFGYSVAIDGDLILVGAYNDSVSFSEQGSVYVFARSGAIWTQEAKLTASDANAVDLFGYSVAVSNDTAIIGARYANIGSRVNQGAAYVFTRTGATWTEKQKLTLTGNTEYSEFGYAVDIRGNTAIIGAPGDGANGGAVIGSATIFVRDAATGAWMQQQQINAPAAEDNTFFGGSVAVENDTAIVGEFGDDGASGTEYDRGAVYVYNRAGTIWTERQKLQATGGESGDSFGISVGLSGDTIVAGADYDTVGSNYQQGSAYVFSRGGETWTQTKQLNGTNGKTGDSFGRAVAVSNNRVVVGAPYVNVTGSGFRGTENEESDAPMIGANQGAAYFFNRPVAPTATTVTVAGTVIALQIDELASALVTLTDANGNSQTVSTGKDGAFEFTDVPAGEIYIISVRLKRHRFALQTITPLADVMNITFVPQ